MSPQAVKERSPGMMKFVTAHQNHHFASACTEASSACAASASSANIVIIMGAMVMASIFVAVIISLLGIIRLPLLIMMPFILAVLGMNLH
ncbi:MAG: hypothetical protein KH194_06435 [Clostridiales bacterium]|jgi:lipoprotein|nr:hypothetical protein [Clostridiales bacterium]